jgi:hypothetical protein
MTLWPNAIYVCKACPYDVFPEPNGLNLVDAGFDVCVGEGRIESSTSSRYQFLPVNDLVRTRCNARSKECDKFNHQLPIIKVNSVVDVSSCRKFSNANESLVEAAMRERTFRTRW